MVLRQLMSAAGAELVRDEHRSEATAAACGNLPGALWTEVKIVLDMGTAGGAVRDQRQAQQEINDRADAARKDKTDHHPEAWVHGAAWRILADVADHQTVDGSKQAPGKIEVSAQRDRWPRMMTMGGQDEPEVVFNEEKDNPGENHGPDRDEPGFFVKRYGLRVAHS